MSQWLAIAVTSRTLKKVISMKRVFVSVASVGLLLAFASILCVGQSDIETRAAALSKALVNGHIAWRTKLSSGGASIEAKEAERQSGFVKYYLLVSGLPTDELYSVMSWPVLSALPSGRSTEQTSTPRNRARSIMNVLDYPGRILCVFVLVALRSHRA